MTIDATSTQRCASCQALVSESDAVYCRVCGKPHHAACWNATGHCATPECPGIQAVRVQSPENMMPPPPPAPGSVIPPPPVSIASSPASIIPGFVNEVGLSAALSNGWSAFRDNMGLCIGMLFLYGVVMMVSAFIPFAIIFVGTIIVGGLVVFGLNVVSRRDPAVGDLFVGFQNYGRWLGAVLLYGVIMLAVMLPAIAWLLIRMIQTGYFTSGSSSDPFGPYAAGGPVYYVLYCLGLLVLYTLMMRWYFYLPLIAEGAGIMEAFGKSVEMTEGIRWRLFGITLVLGLIHAAGVFTCVGWLFTIPLIGLSYISLYVAARNQQFGPQL